MFNRFTTIFLGKDNCHYTTKEKQTGSATLDDKSQVQYLSKTPPKMPFFYHRRNLYLIGFLLAFIVTLLECEEGIKTLWSFPMRLSSSGKESVLTLPIL